MEAVILAGGLGTRLQSVIVDRPKPMAPISGKPFLEILLNSLSDKGFKKVILSLGYMSESIVNYFGDHFAGLELDYVIDSIPLGTGGAIRNALLHCSSDHVFVFNGDTFLDLEISAVELNWQLNRRPIIVARQVKNSSRYGCLVVDDGRVVGFSEKGKSGPGLINAGCYVLPRNMLDAFNVDHPFSIEGGYLAAAVKTLEIDVFISDGYFIDIGIPEDYSLAQIGLRKWIK